MPGSNAGTGRPITLRCSVCRKHATILRGCGYRLVATGNTQPMAHHGIRQTNRKIQYRCLDCGHTGWTQHIDAERLLKNG